MTECTLQATPETARDTTREQENFAVPAVDIFEKDSGLVVVADIPGVTKDGIEVTIDNDILTIRATPAPATAVELAYREFSPTGYQRQFRLGNKIDGNKIDAQVKHGVLRLVLPFAEKTLPRTIDVKIA